MRPPRVRLTILAAAFLGVVWPGRAPCVSGFPSPGAVTAAGQVTAVLLGGAASDEDLARQMRDWVRLHGRTPTWDDLRRDDRLRAMWRVFRRTGGDELLRQERDQARKDYQAGLKAFDAKNYPESIRLFGAAARNDFAGSLQADAKGKLKDIDKVAAGEIAAARKLAADGKFDDAFKAYDSIISRFKGVPSGEAAAKELAALRQSPEYQAKLRKDRAALILKNADAAYAAKQYLNAYTFYDALVTGYADLDEGKAAAAKLQEIKADTDIMGQIEKDRSASDQKSLLGLAKSLISMGAGEKAIPRLLELVQVYPESDAATEGRALLAHLGVTVAAPATMPAPAPAPKPEP